MNKSAPTANSLTPPNIKTIPQAHESQTVSMKDDLKKMKRVLKRLGYTSTDGVLGTKGRFSCELSTPDELVLTDMVFDGVFNDLKIEQAVALVSCFVFKEGMLLMWCCVMLWCIVLYCVVLHRYSGLINQTNKQMID